MAWEAAIHSTRKQRAGSVRPKGNDAQMEILTDKKVSFPSISSSSRIIPTVCGFRPMYHSIGDAFTGCGAVGVLGPALSCPSSWTSPYLEWFSFSVYIRFVALLVYGGLQASDFILQVGVNPAS